MGPGGPPLQPLVLEMKTQRQRKKGAAEAPPVRNGGSGHVTLVPQNRLPIVSPPHATRTNPAEPPVWPREGAVLSERVLSGFLGQQGFGQFLLTKSTLNTSTFRLKTKRVQRDSTKSTS